MKLWSSYQLKNKVFSAAIAIAKRIGTNELLAQLSTESLCGVCTFLRNWNIVKKQEIQKMQVCMGALTKRQSHVPPRNVSAEP